MSSRLYHWSCPKYLGRLCYFTPFNQVSNKWTTVIGFLLSYPACCLLCLLLLRSLLSLIHRSFLVAIYCPDGPALSNQMVSLSSVHPGAHLDFASLLFLLIWGCHFYHLLHALSYYQHYRAYGWWTLYHQRHLTKDQSLFLPVRTKHV